MVDNNEQVKNTYKRKRKKSFLKNARKYGKKGCYGRGSEIDAETYQYLVRIMEVYKEGFPSEDEKCIFVNNVFHQIENQEINCCCNQLGCRVIQMLLPFAGNEILENYMEKFTSDLRPLCSDRFASHVLQTLVEISCRKSLEPDTDADFKEKCRVITIKISKFLLNNLEDYIWDNYGNHIIRSVFINLSQLPIENSESELEVPEEYVEIVNEYAERLIRWPQFKDMPYSDITSALLQILLKSLSKVNIKKLKKYLKKLLEESFVTDCEDENKEKLQQNKLSDVFMSKPAIMLIETALEVAPPKLYTQIYAKCFINNLVKLATTRNTNFSVQKLLNKCKEKSEFEAMYDELSEHFTEILNACHTGVILALAQGCKRLSTRQGSFIQNIMKAFNCYEPEDRQLYIILCLCKLQKYEDLQQKQEDLEKSKLNLHGAIIVQLMLEYNKPIKIVNSILSIDTGVLKNLLCNSMGGYITESFTKSQFVGEKSRDKLVKKMQGTYQELASSKYGSRSFEAIWNAATIKNRGYIMNELVHKDGTWSNSEYGRIIANKVNLVLYKRNKEEWQGSFNKVSKTKAMFSDIIGE